MFALAIVHDVSIHKKSYQRPTDGGARAIARRYLDPDRASFAAIVEVGAPQRRKRGRGFPSSTPCSSNSTALS